jgi:ribosomal protein S18 acetylase RimI-like enzyme
MVKIRYMKKSEVNAISSFRKKYLGEFIEDKFKKYIHKNPNSILVAQDDSEKSDILGYAFSYLWRSETGIIHHLLTTSESKSKIEDELLESLHGLFRQIKLTKAYAWARAEQKTLIKKFYAMDYNLECEMLVFENNMQDNDFNDAKGNKNIEIREFQGKYLDDIIGIEEKCFKPSWHQKKEDFIRYAKKSNSKFSIAVIHDEAVGYLQITASDNLGYLGRVAVSPAYQRNGIGTQFTHDAMKWFEEHNVKNIRLRSPLTDHPAHNLYKKFGFSEIGKEYEFVKQF